MQFNTFRPDVLYLGIWFFTQFYSGLASLGAVTMGGFVFGLVMVRRFLFWPVPRPQSNYFYQTIEPPSNERSRW